MLIPTAFRGAARRLLPQDIDRAAAALRCDPAAIDAVCEVEAPRGAFDATGRPEILYERHIFHRLTGGRHLDVPDLSDGRPGGYGKFSEQYPKLERALRLDRPAALKACSWGRFQVLGENHAVCGYRDVDAFVEAMCEAEGRHLDAFVAFVIGNKLDDELRRLDWAGFARGYNGPAYAKNAYDTKLADAYRRAKARRVRPAA